MQRRLTTATVLCGTLLGTSGAAWAQSSGPLTETNYNRNSDVQSFRPAPGPYNFLTVAGARVDGNPAFSVGAFANYSYLPFTIYNADCPQADRDDGCRVGSVRSRPIEHLATLNILASLTFLRRIQIGLDIPVSLAAGQEIDPTNAQPIGQRVTGALADPRLEVKVRIVGDGLSGPALAARVFVSAPVGQFMAPSAFLGDALPAFGGQVIGDFRRGRFSVAVNAGVLLRASALTGQTAQTLSSFVGNRFTWGVAGGVDITPRLGALLEVFGSTDFQNPGVLQQNAAEADLGVRYRAGDFAITAGAGTGLIRGVGVPLVRGFAGFVWAPVRIDTDRDGISDELDRCPTEPEDRDGFEDADGCPEPDNDGDTVLDERDRCPNEPEDRDNFQDADGCPDRDNDNDGIADGYDTCPLQPEDRDGDRDDDGCPDNDRDRDGVTDDRDRCPTEPEDTDGFQDEDGCPDPDNDNDRIPDAADQCGEQPETYNGFQDDDGCPDELPDRDHDGISDERDQCPDQPETYNGVTDEDGCPERGRSLVEISGDQIRILQQVNFATNSDRIVGARSFQVLDAVVAVLRAHPELANVEVQGHTDNVGDAEHNRDLSQRRAASVRTYLVGHGIADNRLTARGFGPDRPIESNTTRRGRGLNRRVEFHVVAPGGGAGGNTVTEPAPPAGGANAPAGGTPAPPAGGASTPPAGGGASAPAGGTPAPAAGGASAPAAGGASAPAAGGAPAAGAAPSRR